VSLVQGIPSKQVIGVKTQKPFWQESTVHARPSSQIIGVLRHPANGSQVSLVQGFPSLQDLGISVQVPLRGLQLAITQELVGMQSGEDTQPYNGSQVSFTVHKLLSVQLTGGNIHVPFVTLQRLRVQILKSSQGLGR
jgi:hypothetical protein